MRLPSTRCMVSEAAGLDDVEPGHPLINHYGFVQQELSFPPSNPSAAVAADEDENRSSSIALITSAILSLAMAVVPLLLCDNAFRW